MRVIIAVIVNKLITRICKLFKKNGSQFPGAIVLDYIDNHILDKIKYPKITIAVTGSSGKGSTCILIKHILEKNGYSVALNESGSNGVVGTTTMILNNSSLTGKFKKDVLLLECDERHLKLIFTKKKPDYLVVTNITRDQPIRNGTPEEVYQDIIKIINKDVCLVLNADDPIVSRMKINHKGKVILYAMDKMQDDIKKPLLNNVDFAYCPICHKKLNYEYYHYGHLGKYNCPNKDFQRGNIDILAEKINLDKQEIFIKNKSVYINKNITFAVYACLASYALSYAIGIKDDDIVNAINTDKVQNHLGKEFTYKNHKIIMLETKSENNLSYYQSCKYIQNQKGKKSVIIGFNKVSRRYEGNDLSWLYDVNFELLNDKNIDKIFLFGKFMYDIATRLEYANIPLDKIVFIEDDTKLLDEAIKLTKYDFYTMIWHDVFDNVMNKVEGAKHD